MLFLRGVYLAVERLLLPVVVLRHAELGEDVRRVPVVGHDGEPAVEPGDGLDHADLEVGEGDELERNEVVHLCVVVFEVLKF